MSKGAISTGHFSPDELSDALVALLTEFQHANFEERQAALQAGAEVFKGEVERATPRDTGEMAQSWEIKTKYKDRRYVGSTKTVNGIPLSNILEYAEKSPHAGFIRRAFDSSENAIFDAIKKSLQNGGKN